MPKSRLCQEIISAVDRPLLYAPLLKTRDHPVYQKNSILSHYRNLVDVIVLIDEFCKEHTLPTILDIRSNELKIINEGRISAEEIKSLYFLGKDDSAD
jgi:tRNA A37 threonylcarbamoyladenosine synthetase subunit TsaC/SUA5/YrdC